MPIEHNLAVVSLGAAATAAEAGPIPEIRVSAADAPPGGVRHDDAKARAETDASDAPATRFVSKLLRAGKALAAYGIAGLVGWHLYDFAAPVHLAWPDIFGARNSREQTELLRATQTLSAQVLALQARIDALEKARSQEARNETRSAASAEDMNRRFDEMKAGMAAEIGALSSQVKELREAEAKRAEARAAPALPEKPVAEAGEARKGATVAAHVEPGWKRVRRRGDAFDPARHPGAPGAPRPLGRVSDW